MSISVVYNVDKMLLVITYSDQCTSTEVTSTVYRPIHVTQDHSDLLQAHQTIRSLSQQNDIVGIKEDAVVSIVEMNHLSQRTYICLTVVSNSLFSGHVQQVPQSVQQGSAALNYVPNTARIL